MRTSDGGAYFALAIDSRLLCGLRSFPRRRLRSSAAVRHRAGTPPLRPCATFKPLVARPTEGAAARVLNNEPAHMLAASDCNCVYPC